MEGRSTRSEKKRVLVGSGGRGKQKHSNIQIELTFMSKQFNSHMQCYASTCLPGQQSLQKKV